MNAGSLWWVIGLAAMGAAQIVLLAAGLFTFRFRCGKCSRLCMPWEGACRACKRDWPRARSRG